MDEWTSQRNRRYLNVNIHTVKNCYNLGLIFIESICNADTIISLVEKRLKEFNLDFHTDIIAATNDAAAVMHRFGNLSGFINQKCYLHGIHLAITDILYKNIAIDSNYISDQSSESESENSDVFIVNSRRNLNET